jgi:hypothetical protein
VGRPIWLHSCQFIVAGAPVPPGAELALFSEVAIGLASRVGVRCRRAIRGSKNTFVRAPAHGFEEMNLSTTISRARSLQERTDPGHANLIGAIRVADRDGA